MYSNKLSSSNVAIGHRALFNHDINAAGSGSNVAIGYNSMAGTTTGTNNTAVGTNSLNSNTTGSNNVAIGFQSMTGNASGSSNVVIGSSAVNSATNTSNSVIVGYKSTASNNSVVIGAGSTDGGFTGCVVLGYGGTANASNQLVLPTMTATPGVFAVTHTIPVRIGTTTYKILLTNL
jgi:hypothetical protein